MRLNDKDKTTRKDKLVICKITLGIYCKYIYIIVLI